MKKVATWVLLIVLVGLAACSPKTPPSSTPAPTTPTQPPVTTSNLTAAPMLGFKRPPTTPPWPGVKVYKVTEKIGSPSVNQDFAIEFYYNYRLGEWYETHDENMLDFVGNSFTSNTPMEGDYGTRWFLFKALKPGKTEITFAYRNGDTGPIREQQVFNVDIK